MSVSNTTYTKVHDGDGATVLFSFPFKIFSSADINVYLLNESTNAATLQTLTTHYSVSINSSSEGGSITFVTAPSSTEKVMIEQVDALTQPTDFPTEQKFPEVSIENEFDRSRMIAKMLQRQIDRCLKISRGSEQLDSVDPDLPATLGADKYLKTDSAGTGFEVVDLTESGVYADPVTTQGDLITGSSSGAQQRLAVGDNRTFLTSDGTDPSWADLGTIFPAVNDFRLVLSGGNLTLSRITGNTINIDGTLQTDGGTLPTLAATGLSAGTNYYIYAYMVGTTLTLEASTTSYTVGSSGRAEKTGDTTRRLVGLARAASGPAWADSATQRFVISYNNRRLIHLENALTSDVTLTSLATTWTEVSSTLTRVEFLIWTSERAVADYLVFTDAGGAKTPSVAIAFDGTTPEANTQGIADQNTASVSAITYKSGLSEGYHYATIIAAQDSSSANCIFRDHAYTSGHGGTSIRVAIQG